MPVTLTVFYDEDCGFCQVTLAALLRRDRDGRLLPLPIQGPEGDRLLGHLTPHDRLAAAHVVLPDGRVRSGGDAVAPIARELRFGTPVALAAGLLAAPVRAGYRLVAGNRTRLGRHVSPASRERASAEIAGHRARVMR